MTQIWVDFGFKGECAAEFQSLLKKYPPQVRESDLQFAGHDANERLRLRLAKLPLSGYVTYTTRSTNVFRSLSLTVPILTIPTTVVVGTLHLLHRQAQELTRKQVSVSFGVDDSVSSHYPSAHFAYNYCLALEYPIPHVARC